MLRHWTLSSMSCALKCTQIFTKSAQSAQNTISAHQNNTCTPRSKSASSAQSVHKVHNVLREVMRNWTGAYRDNHQGCCHSDAATCLPISRRVSRPLCRVRHEVYRLLIFSFFAARPCLASEAEADRNHLSGPNMAQIILEARSAGKV